MKSKYQFHIDGQYYNMTVDKHDSKISSEYYANFFGKKSVVISEGKCTEQLTFTPDTYKDLIRLVFLDFDTLNKELMEKVDVLSSKLIQFPIFIITGGSSLEIKKLIKYLSKYAEEHEMYFLLYFKSRVTQFLQNKNELKDVHYSTSNRIFIKQLVEAGGFPYKRSDFYIDINDDLPNFEKLNKLNNKFHDDYSDMEIKHGPNLWIFASKKIEPEDLKSKVEKLKLCNLNKIYIDQFMHRFLNVLPSTNVTRLKGQVFMDNSGNLSTNKFDETFIGLKEKNICNSDCGSFSYFCPQDKDYCAYYKSLFKRLK